MQFQWEIQKVKTVPEFIWKNLPKTCPKTVKKEKWEETYLMTYPNSLKAIVKNQHSVDV